MAHDEALRANWTALLPKVKDRWPKVTDQEWHEIDGDLELLLKKVGERYPALSRTEILSDLTPLLERPEVVEE
jgi:uncharacterized protein YjbJ (UPF0337 family)